jgi:hypothetical protein
MTGDTPHLVEPPEPLGPEPGPKKTQPSPHDLRRTRRRLVTAFVVACVLHLPFTPMLPLFRTLRTVAAIKDEKKDWDYTEDTDLSVPLELLEAPKPKVDDGQGFSVPTDVPREPKANVAKPTIPPKVSDGKPTKDPSKAKDATKKIEEPVDKAKPEVKFAQAEAEPDKSDDADDEPNAAHPSKKTKKDDPRVKPEGDKPTDKRVVGLSGKLSDKVVGKPNVTLAVWFSQLRGSPAEALVAPLFACNAEWRWFGERGVVPLRDLDGVMMTGSQLSDSSKLTVAVQHRLKSSEVHTVVQSLVSASGPRGAFLEDDVARIVFQRKDRIVFPHETNMVFVAPPSGWEPIKAMQGPLALPPSDGRALSLTLQNPARPLKKLGLNMPSRLTEMKLDVFANPDGGSDVQIDFEAPTAEMAATDAKQVNDVFGQSIADMTQLAKVAPSNLGADAKSALSFPKPSFDAVDKRITATVHFAPNESQGLLGLVSKLVCAKKRPTGAAPKAAADK